MNIIKKITELTDLKMTNTHYNDFTIPKYKLLKVDFENGETQFLDIEDNLNISKADYWKIVELPKTKAKVLFEDVEQQGSELPTEEN